VKEYAAGSLDLLNALGFGPEALLMNEPRLFIDRRFLASLVLELEAEFDDGTASIVLFQIGLLHGLRDAHRVIVEEFLGAPQRDLHSTPFSDPTPLAIRFGAQNGDGAIEIPGSWPERFEANARLAKLGPSSDPSCVLSAGYTSGWLSGILEADILVHETECCACGDDQCHFIARELSSWRDAPEPSILPLIAAIPFASLREVACRDLSSPWQEEASERASLDPGNDDVHVWGPVMVLPFVNADATLQAIDRLGRDAETCSVRVVVLDLRNRILDEGFEASALEIVIEAVESWGAELILTGVSPISESTVMELETAHLLLRKSLAEAIATAFQVSDAQRHLL